MQSKHPHLEEDATAVLKELLDYLQEKKINVLLYTPPYFVEYTKLYDQSKISKMREGVKDIAALHQVDYIDYSSHPDFIDDFEIFFNADHLNLCGARKFSRRLASEMAQR